MSIRKVSKTAHSICTLPISFQKMEIITMYDEYEDSLDCWMDYDERRAEAELLRQAQDFDADFYGSPKPKEDDYQDLLDELEYPHEIL